MEQGQQDREPEEGVQEMQVRQEQPVQEEQEVFWQQTHLKYPNGNQGFYCPGPTEPFGGLLGRDHHVLKTVETAYGWRVVCRLHRRVWSWVRGPGSQIEEDVYAEGGMVHHGS